MAVEELKANTQPNQPLVDLLEDLLQEAKDGQLFGFAFAATRPLQEIVTGISYDPRAGVFSLVGGLEIVKQQILIGNSEAIQDTIADI